MNVQKKEAALKRILALMKLNMQIHGITAICYLDFELFSQKLQTLGLGYFYLQIPLPR